MTQKAADATCLIFYDYCGTHGFSYSYSQQNLLKISLVSLANCKCSTEFREVEGQSSEE